MHKVIYLGGHFTDGNDHNCFYNDVNDSRRTICIMSYSDDLITLQQQWYWVTFFALNISQLCPRAFPQTAYLLLSDCCRRTHPESQLMHMTIFYDKKRLAALQHI